MNLKYLALCQFLIYCSFHEEHKFYGWNKLTSMPQARNSKNHSTLLNIVCDWIASSIVCTINSRAILKKITVIQYYFFRLFISRGSHKVVTLPIKVLFGIWSAPLTVLKDERSKMAQIWNQKLTKRPFQFSCYNKNMFLYK